MRNLHSLRSFGPGTTAAVLVLALAAGSASLRADMACLEDCDQPASRLSDISGSEDVEAAFSGFDIFFKPGVPIFLIAPSEFASRLDSNSNSSGGSSSGWEDGGPLPSPAGGAPGSDDPSILTFLNQIINSSNPGLHYVSSPIDPADVAPEPRYAVLAVLGLGWVALAFRKFRSGRASLES